MRYSPTEIAHLLTLEQFPRSAAYDPVWSLENLMGPNVLWLTEALCQAMGSQARDAHPRYGVRASDQLDFLAKEFGVQVWATDLWISASDNWERVVAAGVADQVFPLHAEAHALPYADGFFDALISLDAYHYFGTDDLYLAYFSRFLRSGGQIGIVTPGLRREFTDGLPEHLSAYWLPDFWSFHSPEWWREHWARTDLVDVTLSDMIPEGWMHWQKWLNVCRMTGFPASLNEEEMLQVDAGRNLGFTRVVARKK